MENKKVIILIDGQNLYYTLTGMKIIEKDVNWTAFLQSLILPNDELIRTYWFRPAKLLDTYFTENNIQNAIVYKKYKNHVCHYRHKEMDEIPESVQKEVSAECDKVSQWLRKQKEQFSNIEYAYDQLCLIHDNIEIVKSGGVKIDPYKQVYLGEKGVDISLAVKMIALSVGKKCDKIILISGDYDYSEAVRFAKENMTKIHVVKLHRGYPPKNRSMSRDLSILADKVIDVYEVDLKQTFKSQ